LTAKLSDLKDTQFTPDIKIPTPPMGSFVGVNTASAGVQEAQAQPADDLV